MNSVTIQLEDVTLEQLHSILTVHGNAGTSAPATPAVAEPQPQRDGYMFIPMNEFERAVLQRVVEHPGEDIDQDAIALALNMPNSPVTHACAMLQRARLIKRVANSHGPGRWRYVPLGGKS